MKIELGAELEEVDLAKRKRAGAFSDCGFGIWDEEVGMLKRAGLLGFLDR